MTTRQAIRCAARVFRAQLPAGSRAGFIPTDDDRDDRPHWTDRAGLLRYGLPNEAGYPNRLQLSATPATAGRPGTLTYHAIEGGFGETIRLDFDASDRIAALMTAAAQSEADQLTE